MSANDGKLDVTSMYISIDDLEKSGEYCSNNILNMNSNVMMLAEKAASGNYRKPPKMIEGYRQLH